MQAGFDDEDNRNKCDNEANKVKRKEEMGGTNNDMHSTHVKKYLFTIKISSDFRNHLLLLFI